MAKARSVADENNLIRSFLNSGRTIPDDFDENLTAFRAGTISARAILNPRTEDSKFVTTGRGRQDVALDERDVKTPITKLQAPARQTKVQRQEREAILFERKIRESVRRTTVRGEIEDQIGLEELAKLQVNREPTALESFMENIKGLFGGDGEQPTEPLSAGNRIFDELTKNDELIEQELRTQATDILERNSMPITEANINNIIDQLNQGEVE